MAGVITLPRQPRTYPSASGRTLIELLLAVAVAVLLASSALPAFSGLIAAGRAAAAVNGIIGAVQLARTSAISHRRTVTVCPIATSGAGDPQGARETQGARENSQGDPFTGSRCGRHADWHQGVLVFADRNRNRQQDEGETSYGHLPPLPAGGRLYWRSFRNRPLLRFRPSGLTDWQNGHFLYCPAGGDVRYARQVILNAQGRARLARDRDGDGIAEDTRGRPLSCPAVRR